MIREWELGPQTPAHFGSDPVFSEAPDENAAWRPISAERFGLVNLDRAYEGPHRLPSLIWLQSTVVSDSSQQKRVQLGWLGEIWVFVNGKLITQGKNFYYPEYERRAPDGRLSVENGSFAIPLVKGRNRITLAVISAVHDDPKIINNYGSGIIMRFDDPRGLHLSDPKKLPTQRPNR